MKKVLSRNVAIVLVFMLVLNSLALQTVYGLSDMDNHWATDLVTKWVDNGVINGYPDGSMKPDNKITKAEMAKVLGNLLKDYVQADDNNLSDVPDDSWYVTEANFMVTNGIMETENDVFDGSHYMTRIETLMVLSKFFDFTIEVDGNAAFPDLENLTDEEKGLVEYFKSNGYVNGYPDGTFKAGETVTRAQFIKIIDSIIDLYVYQEDTLVKDQAFKNVFIVTKNVVFENVQVTGMAFIADGNQKPKNGWEPIANQLKELFGANIAEEDIALASPSNANSNSSNSNSNSSNSNNNSSNSNNNSSDNSDKINWKLTWSDEFDGTDIDTSKWTYDMGNWIVGEDGSAISAGWGNNEKEYYTDSSDNSFVEDGKLIIRALKEETSDTYGSYDYTSAKLKTKGLFSQKYGRFEIRAKLPAGQGFWPAFWMLPEDERYGGWAASGEIDILEAWGSKPGITSGTIHYGGVWPNNTYQGSSYEFPNNSTFEDFHNYAVEWTPGKITWFVDGVEYNSLNNWYNQDSNGERYSYPAPFDQEFFMVLNLAVGGWFDGDPTDETDFPSQMEVDYVRVYEPSNGKYDDPLEPEVTVEELPEDARTPLADGNYIFNGDFSDPVQVNPLADLDFGDGWNLVYLDDFGGSGSVSVADNAAKIDITSAGSQDYSVQLIQLTTLGKGRYYELSFDAKASKPRDMKAKIGGGADRGFSAYSGNYSIALSDEYETYTYQFLMSDDTDTAARLEFNLGLSTEDVWIKNVTLKEISEPIKDYNSPKTPLDDGNLLYNGAFDKETMDRMAYWNFAVEDGKANASVSEETRQVCIDMKHSYSDPMAVRLWQEGLLVESGTDYLLTFDAKADEDRDIKVLVTDEDGNVCYQEEVALTQDMTSFDISFTNELETNNGGILRFDLAGDKGQVYLDNVAMKATSVDFSSIDTYPIKNGDFAAGLDPWTYYVDWSAQGTVWEAGQKGQIDISNVGPETWGVLMAQGPFVTSNKAPYVLSFDVESTVARNMEVVIENSSYFRYLNEKISISPDVTHYEFTFNFPLVDSVELKFLMGNTDETINENQPHSIFIDNVDLHVVGAPLPDDTDTGSGDTGDTSGDTASNGPIISNGLFEENSDDWNLYASDGANTELSIDNQELKVLFPAYAGWFKWSTQVYQDTIELKGGSTYRLSFDARSSIDRDIWLEMTGMEAQTVALTSDMTTYTYELSPAEDTSSGKINFLLGTDNMDGTLFEAGSYVMLDNIVIEEVNEDTGSGDTGSGDTGDTSGDTGSNIITVEAELGSPVMGVDLVTVDEKETVASAAPGQPLQFDININVETAGTYTLTYIRKNEGPNGVYFEMKVDGTDPLGLGVVPSDVWTQDTTPAFNLSEGAHTITIFAAAGESTTVYIDQLIFTQE